jgi:hypothetical protein
MLLVDWDKKWFIIKPCDPDDKDAQRWCTSGDKGRKPRFITGVPFGDRMYGKMGWCKGKAYKVCGTLALQLDKEDELIMVFELNDAEEYLSMLNRAVLMHNLRGFYARFQRNPCTKPAVEVHKIGGICNGKARQTYNEVK